MSEEKAKDVKETVTEAAKDVKETVTEAAKDVKETVTKAAKDVKDKTTTIVETTSKVIETTKAKSWWNRIWSAIVGAIMAVAAVFGITTDKVAEQKEIVKQVQMYASDALEKIKTGDLTGAAADIEKANAIGKEAVADVKETVEKVKNADGNDVKGAAIKGAVEGILKEDTKEKSAK